MRQVGQSKNNCPSRGHTTGIVAITPRDNSGAICPMAKHLPIEVSGYGETLRCLRSDSPSSISVSRPRMRRVHMGEQWLERLWLFKLELQWKSHDMVVGGAQVTRHNVLASVSL